MLIFRGVPIGSMGLVYDIWMKLTIHVPKYQYHQPRILAQKSTIHVAKYIQYTSPMDPMWDIYLESIPPNQDNNSK